MLIVFEGVDGSGKSTQLALCRDWLKNRGLAVTTCQDPGSTELGIQIRNLLLQRGQTPIGCGSEMFLFMAARAQLVSEIIQPALQQNLVVLCDRFLLSTVVYQGHAGDLEPQAIWDIGQTATSGVSPDLTLVFDLPVSTAVERIGGQRDSMESRGTDYLTNVRNGFITESQSNTGIKLIDASGTPQDIHDTVCEIIQPLLP